MSTGVHEVRLGGILARKGSVAAFMANARVLSDPAASEEARTEAELHIVELLPALRALGRPGAAAAVQSASRFAMIRRNMPR
ncbi:hypothetical protein F0U60_25485 [Archangium minus]|uniref:Uncharacterized protein n=1 Tax=Archangium minus TaxID=83450 RepID=A0ABY9WUS6_9BACT|nr:hypothetical protein F0U61_25750 [Archangium violaceum]WNG47104.1 hypothetical protein F0U60_25485 [Archangium minus]